MVKQKISPEGLSLRQLRQVEEIAKAVHEDVISCAGDTTGMCYGAAKILLRELKKAGFSPLRVRGTFEVDEPNPEITPDEAFESGEAYTPTHHWVELEGLIVDVTATQFNSEIEEPMPDIVIGMPQELGRYRALKKFRV